MRREGLLWVENPMPCSFCRALDSFKGLPLSLSLSSEHGGAPIYRVLMPGRMSLVRILSTLETNGLNPVLLQSNGRPRIARLTRNQIRALMTAYEYGFFDSPKKIGLIRLSQILGVKPSTLDEILRRALKKLVQDYLERGTQLGDHGDTL